MDNTRIDWADMTWNPVTGCRNGCRYAVSGVREEIADVQIMLDQMKILYGDVENFERDKLKRLLERLEEAHAKGEP